MIDSVSYNQMYSTQEGPDNPNCVKSPFFRTKSLKSGPGYC